MEMSNIKKITKISFIALGLNFTVSPVLQSAPVSYTPDSPVNAVFTDLYGSFWGSGGVTGTPQPSYVDVNFDGINDLTLYNERYTYGYFSETSWPESFPGAGDDYYSSTDYYERTYYSDIFSTGSIEAFDVFPNGSLIGPDNSTWINSALYMDFLSSSQYCDGYGGWIDCYYYDDAWGDGTFYYWGDTPNTYVGFSFLVNGAEHFGWADVDASAGVMRINSWGWETDAGVGILAGVGTQYISPVPLPPAIWLFSSVLIGLFGVVRRKR